MQPQPYCLCFAYLIWTMQYNTLQHMRKTLHKNQTIQNICVKMALNKFKYSSSTKPLKTLHWPPIWQRITLTFKCIHNTAPVYLQELVTIMQYCHIWQQHYGLDYQSTSEISHCWINSRPNLKPTYTPRHSLLKLSVSKKSTVIVKSMKKTIHYVWFVIVLYKSTEFISIQLTAQLLSLVQQFGLYILAKLHNKLFKS